jgi:hypothetical protein
MDLADIWNGRMQHRFIVDVSHCERAAEELYRALWQQDIAFFQRWALDREPRLARFARGFGLVLSVLGLVFCLSLPNVDPNIWGPPPGPWFILLFAVGVLFFYLLPRLTARMRDGLQRFRMRSCRRCAERLVVNARENAPFVAVYTSEGDALTYAREKNGELNEVWMRTLVKHARRGLAVRGQSVTAIFRRPTSLVPSIVVLHDESQWLTQVLEKVGIAIVDMK